MDFRQFFKYGLSDAEISFDAPSTIPLTYSNWPLGSSKFDLGSSPHSPLCIQFDREPLSMPSRSQDQYSSTDSISGVSPCHYTPESLQISSDSASAVLSQRMRHALQELETALMAPDTNPDSNDKEQPRLSKQRQRTWSHEPHLDPSWIIRPEKHKRETWGSPRNDVRQLLVDCAEALSENQINDFEMLVQEARGAVSISGNPIQRLGAYMLEGLVARHEASGTNIYRALRCREPEGKELLSYMRVLYDICPYLKFGYMAANGAIAEALRNEDVIHIIDFQIAQGTQWVTLIKALAARPGGPPRVRITGIDDPVSEYARGDSLHLVGNMLSDMSEKFKIFLEFNPLPVGAAQITREMLDIRPGEALAVNFTLQLHHMPDESVEVDNPRDGLLRMVKGLKPKVVTLVEQESHTNTTPFLMRFMETLEYYSAMFESIDVELPRDSKERIRVEQHCLAKDVVNIIACEGKERVERHELLGKWRSRLGMAGFKPSPLSPYVNSVIKNLLSYYSNKYTLVEKDGALLLGWKNRNLISASAWH